MSASRTSETSRTDNLCAKEQALPHTVHHVLGNEFGLAIDESESLAGINIVLVQCSHFVQTGGRVILKYFQRFFGLMAARAVVCQLELLHMRPLQLWLKSQVKMASCASW